MTYTLYLDASKWQTTINFQTAAAQGIQGALLRASVGMSPDTKFLQHWQGSKGVMARGVYHYYLESAGAAQQAQKLFDTVSQTGDLGEEPPTLDVEEINNPSLSAGKIKLCLEEIEKLFGRKPYLYSSAKILDKWIGNVEWVKPYPLWISNPPFFDWFPGLIPYVAQYLKPKMPKSHTTWAIWQFTFKAPASQYGASGNYLDLNFKAGPPTPPPAGGFMVQFKVLSDILNIRNFPDYEQSSIVGKLEKDEVVTATSVVAESPARVWVEIGKDQHVALVHDGTVYLQKVS